MEINKPWEEMTPRERGNANLRLIKKGERTQEQIVAVARMGGIASGEARRRKKRLQDAAKWLLQQKDVISNKDIKARLAELGIDDATNAEALMLIALKKASMGNVEAMKFVRDTGGEAPSNRVELSGDLDKPVATLDLRNLSEEELLRMAEARAGDPDETGADEA